MPPDQGELLIQAALDPVIHAAVASFGGPVAQLLQVALRSVAGRHRVIGELIVQVSGQVKAAAAGYLEGIANGVGIAFEQGGHILWVLQIEVAVGTALPVGLLQALVVANGHQGVLQPVPVR